MEGGRKWHEDTTDPRRSSQSYERLRSCWHKGRLRRAVSDLTLDKMILQEAAKGNF